MFELAIIACFIWALFVVVFVFNFEYCGFLQRLIYSIRDTIFCVGVILIVALPVLYVRLNF